MEARRVETWAATSARCPWFHAKHDSPTARRSACRRLQKKTCCKSAKGVDKMQKIGYARVSTLEQDTTMQRVQLQRAGCAIIFEEKRSAVKLRPELERALGSLQRGDVLVVYRLDRLARSLAHLLQVLERLDTVGAGLKSLTEPIDTASPSGMFMIQILGAAAQFERSLIRERSIAGQREAIARGVHCGRALSVDKATAESIVELYNEGGHTLKGVAQRFGVSDSVVKRLVYKRTKPGYRS